MSDERAVYSATEVCQLLDISDGTLRALMRSDAPPFSELRLGSAVRYPRAEVDAYLGRAGDGEAERRQRLLAHGEALLGAVATQLQAVAQAQAGLAALQGAVGALLAELAPAGGERREARGERREATGPGRVLRTRATATPVAATGGSRRGPRPPNRGRVGLTRG